MFSAIAALLSLLALVQNVYAEQGAWAQCGGKDWSGSTACVSGYVCSVNNEWYSQCVPGTASTTAKPSSTTSVKPSTSATSVSTTKSSTVPVPSSTSKVNYWFSFGDSYTQTGFDINGVQPAVGNPLGNPTYPGWTATGGENWVDAATTKYNNSLVLTCNLAYGGATIDAKLVTPYTPTVRSLTDQVNDFLAWNAKQSPKPWSSANTLFSIWIGINDIGNSYYLSGDRGAFSDTLLAAEFALVQKLYDVGARNFLFINVPPIERSPLMLSQSTDARANEKIVITGFNQRLATAATNFKSSHSGVSTWLYDSDAAFTKILNAPTTYGFTDATSYGQTGSFWGNDYHPGSAAQVIFGKEVGQLLAGTPW